MTILRGVPAAGRPGLALLLLAGAATGARAQTPDRFDGRVALGYVAEQLAFGPRIPGTEGHRRMGDWLEQRLRARAPHVVVQQWTHQSRDGVRLPLRNLVARFNPTARQRILLVAHWDTRPRSDATSGDQADQPVPGANDGGSGVAVLLHLADRLASEPPEVGVDLLFVDGEDYGSFADDGWPDVLIGSQYYAANPLPGPAPRFAIVFDMVGDRDLVLPQEGYSVSRAPEVVRLVWDAAARLGHDDVFVPRGGHTLTDDHLPLQRAGIPAIVLIDFDYGPGHAWWHTPDDTIDKLSARSLEVVGRVALEVIRSVR